MMNLDPTKARSLSNTNFQIGKKIIGMAICHYFNLPDISVILVKKRKREIVFPRQVAHYFGMQCNNATQSSVGKYFGDKNHSTALHSCRTINDLIDKTEGGNIVDGNVYEAVCSIALFIENYLVKYRHLIVEKTAREKRNHLHIRIMARRLVHYRSEIREIHNILKSTPMLSQELIHSIYEEYHGQTAQKQC